MFARCLLCFLLIGCVTACGPDEDPDPNNIIDANVVTTNNATTGTNNTSGTNNTNNNTGIDVECLDVECPGGRKCVRGVCVLDNLLVICEDPEELGVVDMSEVYTGTGDTSFYADAVQSSCGFDGLLSGPEYAVRFRVDAPGVASFAYTSDATLTWLIEVREDCWNADMALCTNRPDASFAVEPGRDYWVIVQPEVAIDAGIIEWTLEFEAAICTAGKTCEGDSLLVCDGGEIETLFACGTSCADGACEGNTCANAVVVTAPMSFAGDGNAYTNEFNFSAEATCSSLDTPGQELVLSLPGLTAGQVVIIDADMGDSNDNAIFVLDQCDVTAGCLTSNDIGDRLEWTVEADGDYFVVIDKVTSSNNTFAYAIDFQ